MNKKENIFVVIDLERGLNVECFKSTKSVCEYIGTNEKFLVSKDFPVYYGRYIIKESTLTHRARRGNGGSFK